jgi:integrase
VHEQADQFLRAHDGSGTQRTYAYLLVDHLRWLERECLPPESVALRDLQRYMGIVGAKVAMPLGEPWRAGKRPYGQDALSAAASCLKGFYLHLAALGHLSRELPANPLAPRRVRRRHPKMLPDGARDLLGQAVMTARDRLVLTWLGDGGFRIGELCGLHLADLHLHENAECGDCRPYVVGDHHGLERAADRQCRCHPPQQILEEFRAPRGRMPPP